MFGPAKSDTDEFGNWLGVPPDLVYEGAHLLRHRGNCLAQNFEEIFAAEELLPIILELDENTSVLSKPVNQRAGRP